MSALSQIKQSLKDAGYYNIKKESKKQRNGIVYHYYTASKDFKYNIFNVMIAIYSTGEYYDAIVEKAV